MQTKPKQKLTAILIAFTMILTTMMQLCIPVTVHAEESTSNRTVTYKPCISYTGSNGTDTTYSWNIDLIGQGHFHLFALTYPSGDGKAIDIFVASDKSFIIENNYTIFSGNTTTPYQETYKSVLANGFHQKTFTLFNTNRNDIKSISIPKEKQFTSFTDLSNWRNSLTAESFDFTKDDYEEKPSWIELDEHGTYSEDIPTPKIKVSSNLDYTFENGQSDYFYEVRGRWRSIDNITVNNYNQILSKGQIYYKTVLKGDLLWWVTANDKKSILETGNLTDIGHDSFYDFISKHPIDSRTIVASGNGFYNPFDETIPIDSVKTSLKSQSSAMNSFEIYIRYYKIDDKGNYIYGKWSHYYNNLIENGFTGKFIRDYWDGIEDTHYQSQNGLTKDELENVENLDDSLNDSDITTITNPDDTLDSELDFSKLTKVLMSLYEQAKTIFSMYGTVFNFLPEWVINIISVSFVIVCFVGIWKVIR